VSFTARGALDEEEEDVGVGLEVGVDDRVDVAETDVGGLAFESESRSNKLFLLLEAPILASIKASLLRRSSSRTRISSNHSRKKILVEGTGVQLGG
jgi:hypothetical protein